MPPSSSLENPFSPPKERNPDDASFVGEWLDPKETAAMRKLLGKKQPPTEPKEDWSGPEGFDLSPEEKRKMEEDKVFGEILVRESQALRKFFGREIPVPPLPAEITPNRFRELKEKGIEIHYLPPMEMTEDKKCQGWKKRPNKWFYEQIKAGKIDPSAIRLFGGWIAIDGRQKPNYQDGQQVYENDFLAPVLQGLNREGVIRQATTDGTPLSSTSRFGISPEELEKPETRAAFAKALGMKPDAVFLPRFMEWSVLANIHHPEWGDTNTWEWFSDSYDNGRGRLRGGGSDGGGLSFVGWRHRGRRRSDVGFRLLGRFSS